MKVIIAGSRGITDYNEVLSAIEHATIIGIDIDTVISGTARGVDQLGERYAKENGLKIERYPADWGKYGKSAGYVRNSQMAELADAAIINSKGTKHMLSLIEKNNIYSYLVTLI